MGLARNLPGSPLRRILFLFSAVGLFTLAFVLSIWYGMNSDRDNVPRILYQLLPAGNCNCKTSATFTCNIPESTPGIADEPENQDLNWRFEYVQHANDWTFSHQQCDISFPGLFYDVERAESFWQSRGGVSPIDLDQINVVGGVVRGRITNGHLYIIEVRANNEDHRRKILSTLSAMYRALISAKTNEISHLAFDFVLSVEDLIADVASRDAPIWAIARSPQEQAAWLYPEFGFWTWNHFKTSIGPYDEMVENITRREEELEADIIRKLIWRGKLSFAPKMRRDLLYHAKDQPWSDVQELEWSKQDGFVSMQDHCRWLFLAHVEGRSYSASLKYRLACRSVVVSHKLQYIQHYYYLLSSSGPNQNYVEVERDFSDLESTMNYLLESPEEVENIRNNSIQTFRERYLTDAAEACYWRRLWEGWQKITDLGLQRHCHGKENTCRNIVKKGMRYEDFVTLPSDMMLQFSI